MPIYEYCCTKCGEVLEVIQKIGDRPPRRCRSCRGKLEKMISRSAFVLKGGGWFAEGYSGGGGPKAKPATSSTTEKSGKPSGSGGDAKPSAKTSSGS